MKLYVIIFCCFLLDIFTFGLFEKPCLFSLFGLFGLLVYENKLNPQIVTILLLSLQLYLYYGLLNITVVALIGFSLIGQYIKRFINIQEGAFCTLFFLIGLLLAGLSSRPINFNAYTLGQACATLIVTIGILKFLVKVDRVIAA